MLLFSRLLNIVNNLMPKACTVITKRHTNQDMEAAFNSNHDKKTAAKITSSKKQNSFKSFPKKQSHK